MLVALQISSKMLVASHISLLKVMLVALQISSKMLVASHISLLKVMLVALQILLKISFVFGIISNICELNKL